MRSLSKQPTGDEKFWSQVAPLDGARYGPVQVGYASDGSPATITQRGHLLIREQYEQQHLDVIRRVVPEARIADRPPVEHPERLGSPRGGVTRISIGARDALDTLNEIDQIMPGIATAPTILSITPTAGCPASEPIPAGLPQLNPVRNADPYAGAGVRIFVPDTGLLAEALQPDWPVENSWLTPPLGGLTRRSSTLEEPKIIKEYAGHGTFIAGLLKCVAPGADVYVSNALQDAGGLPDDEFNDHLVSAMPPEGPWPDIISISAGGSTIDGRPLMGMERFVELFRAHDETVLVAAAGNNGNNRQFWPAALAGQYTEGLPLPGLPLPVDYPLPLPGVISVGALRQTGRGLACFSNYGNWVTVYAPGERLVNAFVSNPSEYRYRDPRITPCRYYQPPLYEPCTCWTAPEQNSPASFSGMAFWSGTSFSTPIVAGMIAVRLAEMRKTRPAATSREAAAAVLADAHTIDGVGKAVWPQEWTASTEEGA